MHAKLLYTVCLVNARCGYAILSSCCWKHGNYHLFWADADGACHRGSSVHPGTIGEVVVGVYGSCNGVQHHASTCEAPCFSQ